MGVVLGPRTTIGERPSAGPAAVGSAATRFVHQGFTSSLPGTVAWQYVTTDRARVADPRFTVVRCRDGPFVGLSGDDVGTAVASACACKTIEWFRAALKLFPHAAFLGKLEDDAALHDGRVVSELRAAYLRYGPHEPIWYGYFQWGGHCPASRRNGWYCGEGDRFLRDAAPHCPQPLDARVSASLRNSTLAARRAAADEGGSVVSPFASGGLDVRSRVWAHMLTACGAAADYARHWTADAGAAIHGGGVGGGGGAGASRGARSGDGTASAHGGCEDYRVSCGEREWAGACDGIQGYLAMRCLREHMRSEPEDERPPPAGTERIRGGGRGGGASPPMGPHTLSTPVPGGPMGHGGHVTLLHLTQAKYHDPPPRTATSAVHAGSLKGASAGVANPNGWQWHVGDAMLPLAMRLRPSAEGARWEPENASVVEAFYARAKRHGAAVSAHCGGGGRSGSGNAGSALPCAAIPADDVLPRPASDVEAEEKPAHTPRAAHTRLVLLRRR